MKLPSFLPSILPQVDQHHEQWPPIEPSSARPTWWPCWYRNAQNSASSWVGHLYPWPWPRQSSSSVAFWPERTRDGISPAIWIVSQRWSYREPAGTDGLVVAPSNVSGARPFAVGYECISAISRNATDHVSVECFDLKVRERSNKGWFPRNPRYIQDGEDETKSISNIQALRGALSFPQFYSPSFFSFSTEKSRCYKYLHSIWLGFYFFLVRLKLPTYQCQNSWDASQTTDWPPSWPLVSWWPEELEPPSWWPASSSV